MKKILVILMVTVMTLVGGCVTYEHYSDKEVTKIYYDAEGNELGTHVACYDYKGNMKWEYLVQDDVIYYAEAGEEL